MQPTLIEPIYYTWMTLWKLLCLESDITHVSVLNIAQSVVHYALSLLMDHFFACTPRLLVPDGYTFWQVLLLSPWPCQHWIPVHLVNPPLFISCQHYIYAMASHSIPFCLLTSWSFTSDAKSWTQPAAEIDNLCTVPNTAARMSRRDVNLPWMLRGFLLPPLILHHQWLTRKMLQGFYRCNVVRSTCEQTQEVCTARLRR
jgi:hypothetical protein